MSAVAVIPVSPQVAPPRALTRGDHFRFGFDHATFGARCAPAQRYWTEYGACSRSPGDFGQEMERAFAEMAEVFGRLEIAAAGGPLANAAIALAERLAVPARVLAVALDGAPPPLPPTRLQVRLVEVAFADFEAFAMRFARDAGSPCAWTALAAFAAAGAGDWPGLADRGDVTLTNHAVDRVRLQVVAPAGLALVDPEPFTGLDRFMLREGLAGVAQPLRWSPELMAAQLGCPQMRRWIAIALAGGTPAAQGQASHGARNAMWRAALPGLGAALPAPGWPDPALRRRMRDLTRRLERRAPGSGTLHFFPLHRLAGRLGIAVDGAEQGEGAALYGRVAPGPLSLGAPA